MNPENMKGAVLLDDATEKEAVLAAILAGVLEEMLRLRMAIHALAVDPGNPHSAAEKALTILVSTESLLPPPDTTYGAPGEYPESDPGDEQPSAGG